MQTSIVVLTYSVLYQKHVFWANLINKLRKLAVLSCNVVFRITWICRIQWCCSIFLLLTANWSKISKLFVHSEIWYQYKYLNANAYSNSLPHSASNMLLGRSMLHILFLCKFLTYYFYCLFYLYLTEQLIKQHQVKLHHVKQIL